jgi:hypothetical protein
MAKHLEIREGHDGCPGESPWGVVDLDTGETVGCHTTEEQAQEQRDLLYGEDGPVAEAAWRGPLAVEGITTGDGREFAPKSLTWEEPPLSLRWNKEDSHGGQPRTLAVNVGRIDWIWREDDRIMGEGVLNLAEPDGQRVYDLIKGRFIRGVSIDADSIGDADIEFVWPEDDTEGADDEGDILDLLFAQPEKMIFHAGRIRAATLVDIPAFAEAYVEILDEAGAVVAGGRLDSFGPVASHDTPTTDESWDGPASEQRLPSPMTVETARDAYAWIDTDSIEDGELTKQACRFIHHEVSAQGRPGAANLTACSTGIGVLNGARGGTTIPGADIQGVYNHLARHLRDAGRTPPELMTAGEVVTASADVGEWVPPAAWFRDPGLSVPTAITIDASGRVYGHAAQWGSCHVGFSDQCVQPPREDGHPFFMTGELTTEDGSTVAVGQLTVGTGHAPLNMGASPAAEHYDNTGSAVADVAVGNDRHGIWVAGAVRGTADADRVHELRASGQVSGDWRRIGGQLRLVGLLAVNVPGFPVPRMAARVASGAQMALVAAGRPSVSRRPIIEPVKVNTREVLDALAARVHGR